MHIKESTSIRAIVACLQTVTPYDDRTADLLLQYINLIHVKVLIWS